MCDDALIRKLITQTLDQVYNKGMIDDDDIAWCMRIDLVASDATGFESGQRSRYFTKLQKEGENMGDSPSHRTFPKLGVVVDCATHLILAACLDLGPRPGVNELHPLMRRIGEDKLNVLLTQTIEVAVKSKHLPERDLKQVNVDTTVQEKNITHPTDSKLLYKAIVKLGAAAKARGITLRQSYLRVGKRASVKVGRYAHAIQFKRMRRQIRKLRTYVGRLIRDIQRKVVAPNDSLTSLFSRCLRLRDHHHWVEPFAPVCPCATCIEIA